MAHKKRFVSSQNVYQSNIANDNNKDQICRLAAGAGTRWCAGDTEDTEGGCEGGGGGDGGGGDPVEQESALPVQFPILLRRLNILLQLGWLEL